ncbi:uncharacterized protein LOC133193028 [Saccostrea echinata]|uniref:uncharacterized protein LOC133193028 n=1 Tax=Saccostrea echinata TaxID=191078 RepID=UPI002A809D4C|nr:uncharacterized protein LOC133193028 [Saccostrea echinata]
MHKVVLYQELALEKCHRHPTKALDMLCGKCQDPLCYKCALTPYHREHNLLELEEIHLKELHALKIKAYFLPASKGVLAEIKDDVIKVEKRIDEIKRVMKAEAKAVKYEVDTILSQNMNQLDQLGKEILHDLDIQKNVMDDYILYLNEILDNGVPKLRYQEQRTEKIDAPKPIPDTFKIDLPIFTPAQFNRDDILILLGKTNTSAVVREKRNVNIENQLYTDKSFFNEESYGKKIENPRKEKRTTLSSSIIQVRDITVPGLCYTCHISLDKSNRLWVSDLNGHLIQTNLLGTQERAVKGSAIGAANHTVSEGGDLLFIDNQNSTIQRLTPEKMVEFITTKDWRPISIYSSQINGDVLIGMITDNDAKVIRYNKTGEKIQDIKKKGLIHNLYEFPGHLTENINGDICTSDWGTRAVVVVNKSGKHRFSYTGQPLQSEFWPRGICTDVLSHILVCDDYSQSVHLMDQDSNFLSLLITQENEIKRPRSLCIDEESNLYVGEYESNLVKVFIYLE